MSRYPDARLARKEAVRRLLKAENINPLSLSVRQLATRVLAAQLSEFQSPERPGHMLKPQPLRQACARVLFLFQKERGQKAENGGD